MKPFSSWGSVVVVVGAEVVVGGFCVVAADVVVSAPAEVDVVESPPGSSPDASAAASIVDAGEGSVDDATPGGATVGALAIALDCDDASSFRESPTSATTPPAASTPITWFARTNHKRNDDERVAPGSSAAGTVAAVLARAVRLAVDVGGRPVDAVAAHLDPGPPVVVLIYHRVGARTPSPVDLPRATFTDQLDRLADHALVVDLDTAADLVRGELQPRSEIPHVALTFDDGTADWVDVVLPELVVRRMPATFYVATDFVERGRPFPDDGVPTSWRGLVEMSSTGMAKIASHTHTHQILSRSTAAEAERQVDRSAELIEEHVGAPCRHFAYPNAVAPSPAAEIVIRRRFTTAALAGNRPNRIGSGDLHRLGRHPLTTADDIDSFECKVRGGARLEGALREVRDRRAAARPAHRR